MVNIFGGVAKILRANVLAPPLPQILGTPLHCITAKPLEQLAYRHDTRPFLLPLVKGLACQTTAKADALPPRRIITRSETGTAIKQPERLASRGRYGICYKLTINVIMLSLTSCTCMCAVYNGMTCMYVHVRVSNDLVYSLKCERYSDS